MLFKVDENLPVEVAQVLRDAGHEAVTVLDQRLGGSADALIASICQQEERTLITLDLDFADIRAYPPVDYAGVIVFHLRRQDKPHILEVCARIVPLLTQQPLPQRLWIVEEDRLRIRG